MPSATSTSFSTRATTSGTVSTASPTISRTKASSADCCSTRTSWPTRCEWKKGTMIVPPSLWFHQHFNTGTTPARYLAFKSEGVSIRNAQGVPKAWISRRLGGDQIDYADESPRVRQWFAEALATHGLTPRMDEAYALERADLPSRVPQTVP